MPRHDLAALGRFSEPAVLILISLADVARHSYAMVDVVQRLSGARLGPGTVYGPIARLERLGLMAPLPAEDRRRPYERTEAGAAALRAELTTLAELSNTGLRRLGSLA
jgi:DNA-binding PadR family transcriptional regulator